MAKLISKLQRKIKNILYSLPFGLKGGNELLTSSNGNTNDGSSIEKDTSDERVGRHLLKGEVTQAVEELRYRTYKVANESENYNYIGNGIAIKKDKAVKNTPTKHRFSQENSLICEGVLNELKRVNNYGYERYRLEIVYDTIPRFKMEEFATRIDVNIDDVEKIVNTTLCFDTLPNPYNPKSKLFISELEKAVNGNLRSNIINDLKNISFTTYKASNEDDFVNYSFDAPKLQGITKDKGEYKVSYEWENYIRLPLDLEAKYYSKSMAEKYEKKERKNTVINLGNAERKRYCSICGKEISVYDGDILEVEGKPLICMECSKKLLKENNQ